MVESLDQTQLESLRHAASALARQEGRGVGRDVLVRLAGRGRLMTLHADGEPVVAVVHPAQGRGAWFETLSARERQVAALVAQGRRNREIAEELVISLPTVKDHVHSILTKTGLTSRAAVTAAWHGHAQSA
jgi:two-component system, NarL family, nitrate/nitrite response regulator NarL